MTTATLEATAQVECTRLADGLLVRLTGALGADELDTMRATLLKPLPAGCRDIVVDAGEVVDVAEPALAVLLAARVWAEDHGARFLLSRSSAGLEGALVDAGLPGALPHLSALQARPGAPVVAVPRPSTD